MGHGQINKQLAKSILFELKQIFDANNIKIFLNFGTCLGAIRDEDFIRFDDDIDLGFVGDVNLKILHKNFVEKGYELHPHNLKGGELSLVKNGIKIDLEKYYKSKNLYYSFIFNSRCIVILPAIMLDNLKEINFLGGKFLVPNQVEKFLEYTHRDWRKENSFFQIYHHSPSIIEKSSEKDIEEYIEKGEFIMREMENE